MAKRQIDLARNGKVSVLDVGSGTRAVSKQFFPDSNPVTIDIDPDVGPDYVHDIRAPLPDELYHKFDIVFAGHILEHIEYHKSRTVLKNLAEALKPGGELWIITPSLEWAADQIRNEGPVPPIIGCLYGQQDTPYQFHKSGWTLMMLRQLMTNAGLINRQAHHGSFQIEFRGDDGSAHVYDAIQNIVVGITPPSVSQVREGNVAAGVDLIASIEEGK